MKFIILDAGPLISLTLNGLLHTLEILKSKFPEIVFLITPSVKREVIDKPIKVKKYELEAVKIQTLLDKKTISLSTDFFLNIRIDKETQRILNLANNLIKADKNSIQIVHEGEASCLALSRLCNCENLIVIDERVTRLLTESPENLKAIM